jgi:hypothetical protein
VADLVCRALAFADPLRATIRVRFKPVETGAPRFGMVFAMNSRSFRWIGHLFTASGAPIAQSIGLVDRADLVLPFRALADLPPGQLYVYDVTGAGEPPRGFGAWRSRWLLQYRLAADVSDATEPRLV